MASWRDIVKIFGDYCTLFEQLEGVSANVAGVIVAWSGITSSIGADVRSGNTPSSNESGRKLGPSESYPGGVRRSGAGTRAAEDERKPWEGSSDVSSRGLAADP